MQHSSRFRRAIRHEFFGARQVRARLPDASMLVIEAAIAVGEARHSAEIRFVVEASLDLQQVWSGTQPRERALLVFSNLRVWDTEANNGILLYVLMADRSVEVVADRAVARRIAQSSWDAVCQQMAQAYRGGDFLNGTLAAIAQLHELVEPHFPSGRENLDELPNRPLII